MWRQALHYFKETEEGRWEKLPLVLQVSSGQHRCCTLMGNSDFDQQTQGCLLLVNTWSRQRRLAV